MKVLVFAASTSRHSINLALIRHAASRLRAEHLPGVELEVIDLNDYEMPIYSVDREAEGGIPAAAHRFYEQIGASDGILVSYAEHNGNYTAAFKNLFDWASRIDMKVFQGTPMVAMSTSPGGGGGANVLRMAIASAPHFAAEIVGSLSVPAFSANFDTEKGVLTDPAFADQLGKVLGFFAQRLGSTNE